MCNFAAEIKKNDEEYEPTERHYYYSTAWRVVGEEVMRHVSK